MRTAIAALLLLAWWSAATAEPVPIRSGEHADFSRLVLKLPEPSDWRLGRVTEGYELRLARTDYSFVLDEIFRYIPRARIADVASPGAGVMRLDVRCSCHADAFALPSGWLVVDVKSGPAPADSPFERKLSANAATSAASPGTPPPATGLSPAWVPQVPPAGTVERGSDRSPLPRPPRQEPPGGPDVAALEETLLAQISRATAQGLIDARLPSPPPASTPPRMSMEAGRPGSPDASSPSTAPRPSPQGSRSNSSIETSIDRDTPAGPSREGRNTGCIDDSRLAVAQWAVPGAAASELAAARRAIFDASETPDASAVRTLARLYLGLGFGAEARAVVTGFGVAVPDAPLLLALADIVDTAHAPEDGPLAGQLECDGPAALWSALGRREIPKSLGVNDSAIRRYFSALPEHLRRHLGPPLVKRFLAREDRETAAALRDALERAPGSADSAPVALTDARLALAEGHPEEAVRQLSPLVSGNHADDASLLALYVEALLAAGRDISPETIAQLDALAFERRGQEARRLGGLSVRASLARGDFEAAFSRRAALGDPAPGTAPAGQARLDSRLFTELAESADDAAFLRHSFAVAPDIPARADAAAREAVARRLLSAGFPARATEALGESWPKGSTPDRIRRLQGRIALAQSRPAAALRRIAGLRGPVAEAIRAGADSELGEHGAATAHFKKAGDTANRVRAAWRAGDWSVVAKSGTRPYRAVAQILQDRRARPAEKTSTPESGDAPRLAAIRARLATSRASRKAFEELLVSDGLPVADAATSEAPAQQDQVGKDPITIP